MRKRHEEYLEEQFEISNSIKKWKILKDLNVLKSYFSIYF